MHVLLLGAGGMLGRALAATLPAGVRLEVREKGSLDITDSQSVRVTLGALRPDCIINAAGYTAVDEAERRSDLAFAINGTAVGQLGDMARELGASVVHFSTDYVFDGLGGAPYPEDAPCNPLSVYGASKLAGERALLASQCRSLVIRTQWLFGPGGRSFPATMLSRARAGTPTRVVDDQRGRPTNSWDLARATWQLVGLSVTGLVHVTNDGEATWFDVAREIFGRLDRLALLSRCGSNDYPTPARRPADSRLSTQRFEALTGQRLPPWPLALERFIAEQP